MAAFGTFGQQGGAGRFFPRMYFANSRPQAVQAFQAPASPSPQQQGPRSLEDDPNSIAALIAMLKKLGVNISELALQRGPELAGADLPKPEIDPLLLPPEASNQVQPPAAQAPSAAPQPQPESWGDRILNPGQSGGDRTGGRSSASGGGRSALQPFTPPAPTPPATTTSTTTPTNVSSNVSTPGQTTGGRSSTPIKRTSAPKLKPFANVRKGLKRLGTGLRNRFGQR